MHDTIKPLTDVMETLLGENGCPWDKEQTHQSLRKNLLEETYEVIEAIDCEDMAHLKEELGDVLLQVVFHAALAEREGAFNLDDVVEAITEKMIRRHPHIFADVQAENAEQVLSNWEEIKKQEKAGKPEAKSIMSQLPPALPALMKAEKVQQKAHRVGFEWESLAETKENITAHLAEFNQPLEETGDMEQVVGGLLFSVVNLARLTKVDPEQALNRSVQQFIKQFQVMEEKIMLDKRDFGKYTVEELTLLWNASEVTVEKNK